MARSFVEGGGRTMKKAALALAGLVIMMDFLVAGNSALPWRV